MYQADPTSMWGLLRDVIIERINKGVLSCPMPLEHLYETAGRSDKDSYGDKNIEYSNKISQQHDFFCQIAKGESFYGYEEIAATEIMMLLKQGKVNLMKAMYFHKTFYSQINIQDIYEDAHSFNQNNHKYSQDLFQGIIQLRKTTKLLNDDFQYSKKDDSAPLFLKALTQLQVSKYIEGLNDFLKKGYVKVRGEQCGSYMVPNKVDWLIFNLTKKRIDKKNTEKLIHELEVHGFDRIPSMNIHSLLSADIALYDKQETPNDEIDIDRAAVGLRISDYFFADNEKMLAIQKYSLDKQYRTKVYSGKKPSVKSLIEELSHL